MARDEGLEELIRELMQMGEKQMPGWVRADARAYGDDALRRKLLTAAIGFVRSLPAK